MNPADLSVLIFLVAVPSVFVLFLWLLWSMARRSRAQRGRYIRAQGSLDRGYPLRLHARGKPISQDLLS
jgi:hypothetical protein